MEEELLVIVRISSLGQKSLNFVARDAEKLHLAQVV